jgi:hypothetical protein
MSRMLKWVGDPPVWKADGWRVANWRYENRRAFPVEFPPGHPGDTQRALGVADGLSRNYMWCNANRYVVEVTDRDAEIIMKACPHEFKDVTGIPEEEWRNVHNDPIILPRAPDGKVLYYGRR